MHDGGTDVTGSEDGDIQVATDDVLKQPVVNAVRGAACRETFPCDLNDIRSCGFA